MLLEILTYPDDRLRLVAEPVAEVDSVIRKLMDDMAETMYGFSGIGLAATQVGVTKRVIVLDVDYPYTSTNLVMLANPEIITEEGQMTWNEGCLSFPGLSEEITRSQSVTVKGLDKDNNPVTIEAKDLLAVALQHEIDHLSGIVLLDHLSPFRRKLAR